MYIEYCIYNKYIEDYSKELDKIFVAIEEGILNIAVPINFFNSFKNFLPKEVSVSVPIDYPCGLSGTKSKCHLVLNAAKSGAKAIDYTPNHYFLKSGFTELAKEIKSCMKICENYGMDFRLFLNYQNTKEVTSMVKLYTNLGVDTFFPTLGYHHDDFVDNIIISKIIEYQASTKLIFNGYLWRQEQLKEVIKAKIYGIRLYNTTLWCNNDIGQDKQSMDK